MQFCVPNQHNSDGQSSLSSSLAANGMNEGGSRKADEEQQTLHLRFQPHLPPAVFIHTQDHTSKHLSVKPAQGISLHFT